MSKCKYSKNCKLYSKDSLTCNKLGGTYLEDKFAGCYNANKSRKAFITLFLILLILPLISAEYLAQKQNNPLDVIISSNNATQCNISTIQYTTQSSSLLNYQMDKNGQIFNYTLNSNYFSILGDVCIDILCTDGNTIETGSICRTVTPSGQANINPGQGMTLLGSLFVIIIVGIGFTILFFKTESFGLKTVWGGLAVVDMIIVILFSMVLITQVVGGYDSLVSGFTTFWFVVKILIGIGLTSFVLFAFYLSFKLWQFKRGYLN